MRTLTKSVLFVALLVPAISHAAGALTHPRLLADRADIDTAKKWFQRYSWYRGMFEAHKKEIDTFLAHGPIYVSPIKQTYQYQMYTCPKHLVELKYDEFKPFEHRCPVDTSEVYRGGKYDMAWAGWYNRVLANHLLWMGLLYNVYGDDTYAAAGREILMKFAELYLKYPTENTILGPAHVFFGTLSESFWGVDMAYGYDLLYNYTGFTERDRADLKDKLFYPLAHITQLFPESASNRQLWYNNVSAAVGFLYGDQTLIDFALKGKYGFMWELGSALPESGFWPEWSGYHFVTLRGMIHLAEMARHNGYDLYHMVIAGRCMKKMFDAPFLLITPNFEFPRSKDSGGGSLLEYASYYEVGYAVYHDPKYLALLNRTNIQRGSQVVGETSALGRESEPITVFTLVPELPRVSMQFYPEYSVNIEGNGFAILRNASPQTYLYLDYGIMGGEHGHPDRLQIGYYAGNRNWIVDPLNESYQVPNLQLWYRQSIAHNTLVVDQTTQTWTNGFGRFFGAVDHMQVASGGCNTAYPGVALTRTIIQVGDYFIDLFDAKAPEKHIFDLPLHGFGQVVISGVPLERQPIDLFGNKPGIPGYDQLTDIYAGRTDSVWGAVFTDKGKHMSVHTLGEQGSEVYRAMTPPIGGFYKQMVTEQVPMPMMMCRRTSEATRFASLIQAYEARPPVSFFGKAEMQNTYCVVHLADTDYVHADVDRPLYWIVRTHEGGHSLMAGFNVQVLCLGPDTLLSSPFPLSRIQCTFQGDGLSIQAPEQFARVRIHAPGVQHVLINGTESEFTRDGSFVVVGQHGRLALSMPSPRDTALFLGMRNAIRLNVSNPTGRSVEGRARIVLARDWEQRVQSQLTWWGGIVNLVATNKGPVERIVFPTAYRKDATWIDGAVSGSTSITPGTMETIVLHVEAPADAAPVSYPAMLIFGDDTLRTSLLVQAPVKTHMFLPNGKATQLQAVFTNQTSERTTVSAEFSFDPAWKPSGRLQRRLTLDALGTTVVTIPLTLTGYSKDNQLYPVDARVDCGAYRQEVRHDFYVGTARFAPLPPSLNGSWNNWDRTNPMLITKASQIGRLLFGNQPWHGAEDLSAQLSVMYDDRYLYAGVAVSDDSLVTHWDFPRMSYPWDTDCMEVVLDTRTNSGQGQDPPMPGLYRHLCLAEYRETNFAAEAWQGAGAGGPLLPKPNLVPEAETYFHRTAHGYDMITRFPLSRLDSLVVKPGIKMGFDFAINDNDGTNYRKNQHIWAGYNQNQSWWDMGTIGALIFGPKTVR